MNGESSKRQSLLTSLLDGLGRFREPVFRTKQLRACDAAGLQALTEAGVLVKAKRATTWMDPRGYEYHVRPISGMTVAFDPHNPAEEYRRIDPEELDQVRLSIPGFAQWIATCSGMESPLEMEPGLWNLGTIHNGSTCCFYLQVSESAHIRVIELAARYPESDEVAIVLTPTTSGATYKTVRQLSNRRTIGVSLASVCHDGLIDLRKLKVPTMPSVVTNADLSRQMEAGFGGLSKERITEVTEGNRLREEMGEISGSADELLGKLIAGFGSNKEMAQLFMLARSEHPKKPGKPITYEQIGKQLGISKQAVSSRLQVMEREYGPAHTHLQQVRKRKKVINYSEMSPTMRRKSGIEKNYGYDEG